MPTLERPTLERNAYMFPCEAPTLELPWSEVPIYSCKFMRGAHPGATLERHAHIYMRLPYSSLPWSVRTYPGPTLDLPWSSNAHPAAAPG
jgi:hypothetical protein